MVSGQLVTLVIGVFVTGESEASIRVGGRGVLCHPHKISESEVASVSSGCLQHGIFWFPDESAIKRESKIHEQITRTKIINTSLPSPTHTF